MKKNRGQTRIITSPLQTAPSGSNNPGLSRIFSRLVQAARLAIGVPDYDNYVRHRRAHHPGEPVMSYEEFFANRQQAKYGRGSTRCC
jgi:uncharacterized short protein YbdD (DUF466 family)